MRKRWLLLAALWCVVFVVFSGKAIAFSKQTEPLMTKQIIRANQGRSVSDEPLFFVDALSSNRGQPRIYEYPSNRNLLYPSIYTSFFSVNIDSELYHNNYDLFNFALVDSFRWETYTHGWCRFQSPENVEVREYITIIREKVHIRLTFTNTDYYSHAIQARYLLDTMIDANDGANLGRLSEDIKSNETEYCCPDNTSVRAVDLADDPSMTGIFANVEGSIFRLVFANWPAANNTVWDYVIDPSETISDDSALLIYYDLGVLAAGQEKSIEFTYGVPGDILVTNPSPGPSNTWYPIVCQTHSHLMADSLDLSWQGQEVFWPVRLGEDLTAFDLQEQYINQGYSLVAITEHYPQYQNLVEQLWQDQPLDEALIDSWDSMEDTAVSSHVLGFGFAASEIDCALAGTDNRDLRVEQIQDAGGVAIVAHPNEPRYTWNQEQLVAASPEAIEIYNSTIYNAYRTAFGPLAGYACGFALGTWDDLLRSGLMIWGAASDDFTNNYLQWFDDGCLVVMSANPNPTKEEVLAAIRQGRFYAAKGGWQNGAGAPRILGYYALPDVKKVRLVLAEPCWYVKFVSAKWYRTRWVVPEVVADKAIAEFSFQDDDGYVRAEVCDFDGTVSFTQPIFLNRLDAQTGSWGASNTTTVLLDSLKIELADAEIELADGQSFASVTAELVPISLRPSMAGLASGIIGECYRFTPEAPLVGQNTLSIAFRTEELGVLPTRLRICQYTAAGWQALATTIEGEKAQVNITSLGVFALAAAQVSDTFAPQVSFGAPLSGATVSGPTTIVCEASDNQGVVEIVFSLDGIWLASDHWRADGWQALVDLSPYPDGSHHLQAFARDLAGNIGQNEIEITLVDGMIAPTISLREPSVASEIWQHLVGEGSWTDDQGLIEGVVTIGGQPVTKINLDIDGTWQVDEWLKLLPVFSGVRELKVIAWDAFGNSATAAIPVEIKVFADVPLDFWAFEVIYTIAQAGISQGYNAFGVEPLEYRPEITVTRDQMAVFIARALAGSDAQVPAGPVIPSFTDVSPDCWAYRHIEYLKSRGIVAGYYDGTYRPLENVTRDQMAVYIARSIAGNDANIPPGPTEPTFWDVRPDFWAYRWIEYLADRQIVRGYPDGSYQPWLPVSRAQMAVYLARAFEF